MTFIAGMLTAVVGLFVLYVIDQELAERRKYHDWPFND